MPLPAGSWKTCTSSKRLRLVRWASVSRTSRIDSGSPARVSIRPVIDAVVDDPPFLFDADFA